jgi:hypothetical protein
MASIVGSVSIEVTPRATMVFTPHVPVAVEAEAKSSPSTSMPRKILDADRRLRRAKRSVVTTLAKHPDEPQLLEEIGLDKVRPQFVATLAEAELDRRNERFKIAMCLVALLGTLIISLVRWL